MARPANNTPLRDDQHPLVTKNLRLAYKYANDHPIRGLEYEDVVSLCFLGLVKAARAFDPSRASFVTYAYKWMQQTTLRHVHDMDTDRRRINAEARQFPLDDRGRAMQFADVDAGPVAESYSREQAQVIREALDQLEPRLAMIIRRHFFDGVTMEAIGAEIGLTRERVRQLKNVAMLQLHHLLDPKWKNPPSSTKVNQMKWQSKRRRMKNQYRAMAV